MKIIAGIVSFFLCGSLFAYDEECLQRAAAKYSIPAIVLKAIIETESAGKRLAINVAGKPYFPDSEIEAESILKNYDSNSVDVGLMQINSFWFKKFNISQTLGLRGCFNINFGAWILAYEVENHGMNLKAIGKYHSPSETKGKAYSSKILEKMIKILNQS